MFGLNLRSRGVMALAGLCAVMGLMAASVGTVQAGAPQTEQKVAPQVEEKVAPQTEEKVKEAAELLRAHEVYTEHLQNAVHDARRAAEAGRHQLVEQLAQARAHWNEARRHGLESTYKGLQERRERAHNGMQERRERLRVAPRIALRRHCSRGGSIAERVLDMSEDLELTEQQRDEIRELRRQDRRASIERDAAIEVADLDLEELMEDRHTADLGAVEQQMQRIGNLRVASRIADLRLSQQVWGMLTAEQREQFQDERHNVFMLRGDGPFSWSSSSGDNFVFDLDADDFMPDEWMDDFDFDFEFGPGDAPFGVWRFRDRMHEDDEVHEEEQEGEVKT